MEDIRGHRFSHSEQQHRELTPISPLLGCERSQVTPESSQQPGNYICPRCLRIDIDSAFSNVTSADLFGTFVTEIGELDDTLENLPCGLCRLFAQVRPDSSGPFDLYAFSSRLFEVQPNAHFGHSKIKGLKDTALLAVIEKRKHHLKSRDGTLIGLRRTGFISKVNQFDGSHSTICGRLVNAELADFQQVKAWLEFCRKHHKEYCTLNSPKLVPSLRLIDCHTKRIVHAKYDQEYVALSYVWGLDPLLPSQDHTGNALPDPIPQVIADAIIVTRTLQFQYLWVDRYCIPQDDQEEKDSQIKLMGSVYKNAQATIVAAAGVGPTFGLPGAGFRHRNRLPKATFGQDILCSTLPDSKFVISKSKWMSRGWTYQEALLSRRLIFFTEDQVYFECETMHCSEAIPPPMEECHTKTKTKFRATFGPGLFPCLQTHPSPWVMYGAIRSYSKRSLTYDKDTLNGMLGVLARFEDSKYPINHFYGVPIFPPIRWSPQPPVYVQGHLAHGFATALLWHHKVPSRRRQNFPSWSWIGWEGEIDYENTSPRYHSDPIYDGCACVEERVSFSVETKSGIMDWETLVQKTGSKEKLCDVTGVLQVTAWTVRLRFVYFPEGIKFANNRFSLPGYYAQAHIARKKTKYDGVLYNCTQYALLSLSKVSTATLSRSLETEEFIAILLGCSSQRALVINSSQGIGDRIGVVDVYWYGAVRGLRHPENQVSHCSQWITVDNFGDDFDGWEVQKERRVIRLG